MGLALEVGILADLKENDDEGYNDYKDTFERLNEALKTEGLPPHNEPESLPSIISYEMFGYSGLHYLRRIAAYCWDRRKLPPPGEQGNVGDKDPVHKRYYEAIDSELRFGKLDLFGKFFLKNRPKFEHLMQHSDAEGFYLPLAFEKIIFPAKSLEIPGEMIGSAPRLLAECEQLAALLELPPDLDPESDEIWNAADSQGKGDTKWKRYGIESFTCLRLIHACRASIETRAALVFC